GPFPGGTEGWRSRHQQPLARAKYAASGSQARYSALHVRNGKLRRTFCAPSNLIRATTTEKTQGERYRSWWRGRSGSTVWTRPEYRPPAIRGVRSRDRPPDRV